MGLLETLQSSREIGPGVAYALGGVLADLPVSAGDPQALPAELVADDAARAVVLEFTGADGTAGTVALIATAAFAEALERVAADELIVNSATPALLAAVTKLASEASVELEPRADGAAEIPIADAREQFADAVAYPLLDGATAVACIAVRVGTATTAAERAPAAESEKPSPPQLLFADVEMGVTAELGKTHMTIREFLSLQPGAVVDLDRTVGTPVDLLVNGTAIARGEVVVIDEEFGVRITEILNAG